MEGATGANGSVRIVGIGGTARPGSTTERAIAAALASARRHGAATTLLGGAALELPLYSPHRSGRPVGADRVLEAIRSADGIILGSPAYHGGVSGLVKNAIDYIEDLRDGSYLDGRPVGLIATGAGWQGAVVTLTAMRSIVHALRGWPTPLGLPINTLEPVFDGSGTCLSPKLGEQLATLAGEVVGLARHRLAGSLPAGRPEAVAG